MLRLMKRCKKCGSLLVLDIEKGLECMLVAKCINDESHSTDDYDLFIEDVNYPLYCISNKNDPKLHFRINEFIVVFEDIMLAEKYLQKLPTVFKNESIITEIERKIDDDIEVRNISNGTPISGSNIKFKLFADIHGKTLLYSETDDIASRHHRNSYDGVDFITLNKKDAQYIYSWMESYNSMFNNDIEAFGNEVSLAFERLYDRIVGDFYNNKISNNNNKTATDLIPGYKHNIRRYVKLYIYKGENNEQFTKDAHYYIDKYINSDGSAEYIAINDKHHFVNVNIDEFKLVELKNKRDRF